MPASREFELDHRNLGTVLRITAEPVDHCEEVFYTDQAPTFEAKIKNCSDNRIEGEITIGLGFGNPGNKGWRTWSLDLDSEPGEVVCDRVQIDPLLHQDNFVLSIPVKPDNTHLVQETDDKLEISNPGIRSSQRFAIYSFHAWERDFYELNYKTPRRSQKISMWLVAGVFILGFFQLLILLGWPGILM